MSNLKQEIDNLREEFGKFQERELRLLNIIESQNLEIHKLHQENQELKDIIKELKGETPRPKIAKKKSKNVSSEKERNDRDKNSGGGNDSPGRKSSRRKKSKKPEIHATDIIEIDKSTLPEDAVFVGYEEKIVRGIKINEFNTLVKRQRFHSKSAGQYFTAKLTEQYNSKYSIEQQVLIIELKNRFKMTESNILSFLESYGIKISAGSISNILLKHGSSLASERDDILKAGLEVSDYIQTDTTACKEKGKTKQSHVIAGKSFIAFYTTEDRKRTTIVDLLRQRKERLFSLNNEFFEALKRKSIAKAHIRFLKKYHRNDLLSENEFLEVISSFKSKKNLHSLLYETAYISGYHIEEGFRVARVLLTDDASVYDQISFNHALCWIHEGRHFKKLSPVTFEFKDMLDSFISQFWDYYYALLEYKKNPNEKMKLILLKQFDNLFQQKTNYNELNDRIQKLYAKKEHLLIALEHPFVPLHNNDCELSVRHIARFRDISFHTICKLGTEARDTFFTIFETAKKMGICIRSYLTDRISNIKQMTSLADKIMEFS